MLWRFLVNDSAKQWIYGSWQNMGCSFFSFSFFLSSSLSFSLSSCISFRSPSMYISHQEMRLSLSKHWRAAILIKILSLTVHAYCIIWKIKLLENKVSKLIKLMSISCIIKKCFFNRNYVICCSEKSNSEDMLHQEKRFYKCPVSQYCNANWLLSHFGI